MNPVFVRVESHDPKLMGKAPRTAPHRRDPENPKAGLYLTSSGKAPGASASAPPLGEPEGVFPPHNPPPPPPPSTLHPGPPHTSRRAWVLSCCRVVALSGGGRTMFVRGTRSGGKAKHARLTMRYVHTNTTHGGAIA